jgi:hypothetical protein
MLVGNGGAGSAFRSRRALHFRYPRQTECELRELNRGAAQPDAEVGIVDARNGLR